MPVNEDNEKHADDLRLAACLVDTVREPLVMLDAELRIVMASHCFYRTFQVTPEKMLGHLLCEADNRRWDIAQLRELLHETLFHNKSYDHVELEHEFEHIGRRTLLINARPFDRANGGDPLILLAIEDVTARKQMAHELGMARLCLERAPMGIFWVAADARILDANTHALQSLGYNRKELRHLHIFDIDPTFSRQRWQAHRRNLDVHRSSHIESVHRRKDGTIFPVEIRGNYLEFQGEELAVSFVHDITERRQAETALRENEKRLRLALKAANQGLYDLNLQTGEAQVSPEYARMLGYDPEKFQETNALWIERMHPDDRPRVAEIYRAYISGEIPQYAVEFRQRTKSGEWIWILSKGQIVAWDTEGRPLRMLGTHTDINDRKKAEAEKAALETQLLQIQKIESVGRLAGGVAHDFNNMLSVILGYAELIKSRLSDGDPTLKDVLEIEKAACHSRDVTRQLLAFSRKQIISPRPVDLNQMIANMQKTLIRLIGEDIDLRFYAAKELWQINFDPSHIDQILVNLAVNARDAMPQGGNLIIETANVFLDETHCRDHPEFTPGRYVLLTASDDGMGMDQETLAHVFEPFFTTKDIGKGSGLGLATVYGIVMQHGGCISVYSEPGKGAAFRIYLPAITAAEDVSQETPEPELARDTGTVLVVEDDPLVCQLTSAMLEKIGYTVLAAASPQEALSICEKENVRIDLMLSDVVMPEMSGSDLRDRMEAIRPGIKVLFMSGYTSDVIVHRGVLDEGVHFIQKPFGLSDLARKIRRVREGI